VNRQRREQQGQAEREKSGLSATALKEKYPTPEMRLVSAASVLPGATGEVAVETGSVTVATVVATGVATTATGVAVATG